MTENNTVLELYKLEYEQAAERYENIYKSVWTNFSYLTAVTAGIIAFGSKGFSPSWTLVFATIPLFFWWLAVFEPANKYGDEVIGRLSEIEATLNSEHNVTLKHFTIFNKRNARDAQSKLSWWKELWSKWLRVRHLIRVAAFLLIVFLFLLLSGILPLTGSSKTETVTIEQTDKPLAVKVVAAGGGDLEKLLQENAQLRNDVGNLKRSLDSISNDLKALKAGQERSRP